MQGTFKVFNSNIPFNNTSGRLLVRRYINRIVSLPILPQFFSFLWRLGTLWIPGYPGTGYVHKAGLGLTKDPLPLPPECQLCLANTPLFLTSEFI